MIPRFRAYIKSINEIVDVLEIDFTNKMATLDIATNRVDKTLRYWWKSTELAFAVIELMQSTGLKDKNGVEIFEGDVCYWKDSDTFHDEILEDIYFVKWSNEFLKWIAVTKGGQTDDLYDFTDNRDLEIIGNIYENPEMLEVKDV